MHETNRITPSKFCPECLSEFKIIHQDDSGVYTYCHHNKVLGCREMDDGEETGVWSESYPFELTPGWIERYKKLTSEHKEAA